ncbi:MAG TPA: hypothetical protein VH186_08090 [Chloroflexia bacterium]|nr:hypothetical protein [Chloroflexia bacterium]
MERKFRPVALVLLTLLSLSLFLTATPAQAATNSVFFSPTGYAVSGRFLDYWQGHGGLPVFGYPITGAYYETDPISGKAYLTQWFERNRFELHPELVGTPYEVLLGLLGRQVTASRTGEAPFQPVTPFPDSADRRYFSATQHSLAFGFKQYWEANGGLERFGYPISEEFREYNGTGTFTVQYFERARFEYHPEKQPPYQVLLGLLGDQIKNPSISPVINNRTGALEILNSYYNAINRKDYQLAYSYWVAPENPNQNNSGLTFSAFVNGYSQTASVGISTGPFMGNGAAGHVYYPVPVVIVATQKNGTLQNYFGCYLVVQTNAQIGNTPPPYPLFLSSAKIQTAAANADTVTLMNQAITLTNQTLCSPNS